MGTRDIDGMTDEEIGAAIVHLTKQLAEFGDVQVLLTYVNADERTITIMEGSGNWNARKALADLFMRRASTIDDMEIEHECGCSDPDNGDGPVEYWQA